MTGTRKIYPSFQNDTRDQRTHLLWTIRWMEQAFRLTKNEGWLMVFSDWRQLPLTSDALQIAGWTWRGIVSWDKTESCRPQLGLFRNQCEYILTATKGRYNKTVRTCPAGCVRTPMFSKDKLHLTAKPIPLMEHLLGILPPGSRILDPLQAPARLWRRRGIKAIPPSASNCLRTITGSPVTASASFYQRDYYSPSSEGSFHIATTCPTSAVSFPPIATMRPLLSSPSFHAVASFQAI